jgi:hypothetical protein
LLCLVSLSEKETKPAWLTLIRSGEGAGARSAAHGREAVRRRTSDRRDHQHAGTWDEECADTTRPRNQLELAGGSDTQANRAVAVGPFPRAPGEKE